MASKKYTQEFRESAVGLVLRDHVKASRVAKDLGVSYQTLLSWVNQARFQQGPFEPEGGADLAARVRELEEENRRLRVERDILKKATGIFARENGGRS